MPKQQKTFPKEFKLEAVRLVKSSGKPMSQIARELGASRARAGPVVQAIGRRGARQRFPAAGIRRLKKRSCLD